MDSLTRYFYKIFFTFLLLNIFFINAFGSDDIIFSKKKIKVKNKIIIVEVADTADKAERGLMFRKKLNENEGMLFVFPSEEYRSFWMKNTFVNLSIAYIDKSKKIINILDMKAVKSEMESNLSLYQSRSPAQFALEMRLGWFAKNNIKVGDKIELLDNK